MPRRKTKKILLPGGSGVLARRCDSGIDSIPDLEVAGIVARRPRGADYSTAMWVSILNQIGDVPKYLILNNSPEDTESYRKATDLPWVPLCEVDFNALEVDLIADMTTRGLFLKNSAEEWANRFDGPVILQEMARPNGKLCALPIMDLSGDTKVVRLGGCSCGLITILSPFLEGLVKVMVPTLIMQNTEPFRQVSRADRTTTGTVHAPGPLVDEFSELLGVPVTIHPVHRIPALQAYHSSVIIFTREELHRDDVISRLNETPFVGVLGPEANDDLAIVRASELGYIPPFQVKTGKDLLQVQRHQQVPLDYPGDAQREIFSGGNVTRIDLQISILSKRAAVVPNLAAMMVLAHGMKPLAAMKYVEFCLRYPVEAARRFDADEPLPE